MRQSTRSKQGSEKHLLVHDLERHEALLSKIQHSSHNTEALRYKKTKKTAELKILYLEAVRILISIWTSCHWFDRPGRAQLTRDFVLLQCWYSLSGWICVAIVLPAIITNIYWYCAILPFQLGEHPWHYAMCSHSSSTFRDAHQHVRSHQLFHFKTFALVLRELVDWMCTDTIPVNMNDQTFKKQFKDTSPINCKLRRQTGIILKCLRHLCLRKPKMRVERTVTWPSRRWCRIIRNAKLTYSLHAIYWGVASHLLSQVPTAVWSWCYFEST